MRAKFGVRRRRRRVRNSRVSEGYLSEGALPHGRNAETFHVTRIARSTLVLICVSICFQPSIAIAQRRATATITIDTSRSVNRFAPSHALGAAIDGHDK